MQKLAGSHEVETVPGLEDGGAGAEELSRSDTSASLSHLRKVPVELREAALKLLVSAEYRLRDKAAFRAAVRHRHLGSVQGIQALSAVLHKMREIKQSPDWLLGSLKDGRLTDDSLQELAALLGVYGDVSRSLRSPDLILKILAEHSAPGKRAVKLPDILRVLGESGSCLGELRDVMQAVDPECFDIVALPGKLNVFAAPASHVVEAGLSLRGWTDSVPETSVSRLESHLPAAGGRWIAPERAVLVTARGCPERAVPLGRKAARKFMRLMLEVRSLARGIPAARLEADALSLQAERFRQVLVQVNREVRLGCGEVSDGNWQRDSGARDALFADIQSFRNELVRQRKAFMGSDFRSEVERELNNLHQAEPPVESLITALRKSVKTLPEEVLLAAENLSHNTRSFELSSAEEILCLETLVNFRLQQRLIARTGLVSPLHEDLMALSELPAEDPLRLRFASLLAEKPWLDNRASEADLGATEILHLLSLPFAELRAALGSRLLAQESSRLQFLEEQLEDVFKLSGVLRSDCRRSTLPWARIKNHLYSQPLGRRAPEEHAQPVLRREDYEYMLRYLQLKIEHSGRLEDMAAACSIREMKSLLDGLRFAAARLEVFQQALGVWEAGTGNPLVNDPHAPKDQELRCWRPRPLMLVGSRSDYGTSEEFARENGISLEEMLRRSDVRPELKPFCELEWQTVLAEIRVAASVGYYPLRRSAVLRETAQRARTFVPVEQADMALALRRALEIAESPFVLGWSHKIGMGGLVTAGDKLSAGDQWFLSRREASEIRRLASFHAELLEVGVLAAEADQRAAFAKLKGARVLRQKGAVLRFGVHLDPVFDALQPFIHGRTDRDVSVTIINPRSGMRAMADLLDDIKMRRLVDVRQLYGRWHERFEVHLPGGIVKEIRTAVDIVDSAPVFIEFQLLRRIARLK